MITRKINPTIIAKAIVVLLMTISSVHATENKDAILTLIEQTGITTQVHNLDDLIRESSQINAARCNSAPATEIITGFNGDSVILDLLSVFEQKHTRSIEPIVNWYQSPLAGKIQSAEKEHIDTAAFTTFLHSEKFNDPQRHTRISKIVDNLQVPRFVAILGAEVEHAGIVHSGCIHKNKIEGQVNREQILAEFTRNDKELTAMLLRDDIIAETAFLYRHLNHKELESYEAFTSSENGGYFYLTLIDAVQDSFELAGNRLINSIATSEFLGHIDF